MRRRSIGTLILIGILLATLLLLSIRSTEGFQSEPRVAIVTANFGGYDTLKEHRIPLAEKVDWYYFTDRPVQSGFWNVITTPYHRGAEHPECVGGRNSIHTTKDGRTRNMMSAKYYKVKMHEIDILKPYDYYIWIDSSITLRPTFLEEILKLLRQDHELISFKHSKRSTLAEEILESRNSPKYTSQPLEDQVTSYTNDGFKDDMGLFENTIMIHKNTPQNARLFDLWWEQNVKHTYQDQISFPYCLWKLGRLPEYVIKENVFQNEKFSFVSHDSLQNH